MHSHAIYFAPFHSFYFFITRFNPLRPFYTCYVTQRKLYTYRAFQANKNLRQRFIEKISLTVSTRDELLYGNNNYWIAKDQCAHFRIAEFTPASEHFLSYNESYFI